jgi:hypothetical protein
MRVKPLEFRRYVIHFQRYRALPVYSPPFWISLVSRRRAMTADIEQCCWFTLYSNLVKNVGIAEEFVTASSRQSALFHATSTILAAILKSGSVTWRINITHFTEKSIPHQTLFTACWYLLPFVSNISLSTLVGYSPPPPVAGLRCQKSVASTRVKYMLNEQTNLYC